jgi:hypothetical protein
MTSGNYGPPGDYGQPGYGPPAPQGEPYGQPPGAPPANYGRPGEYAAPTAAYGAVPPGRGGSGVNVTGIVLAVLGAIAGIIAFTATRWFSDFPLGGKFPRVHDVLDSAGPAAAGVAKAYFGWLAWVLLAVAVISALLATFPNPLAGVMRIVGALVALAGIGFTFWGIKLVSDRTGYGEYLKHALKAPAFYLAVGGFLLVAIAALLGPKRVRAL